MRTVNPLFMRQPQAFGEVPVEGFRAVVETNLTGYFLVAREVTARMPASGGGRIVNVGGERVDHSAGRVHPLTGGCRARAASRCPGSWPPTC